MIATMRLAAIPVIVGVWGLGGCTPKAAPKSPKSSATAPASSTAPESFDPVATSELKLELVPASKTIRLGQVPSFKAMLTNTSDKPLKVLASRDGSDVCWVLPKLRLLVWGPDHKPIPTTGGPRCGNTNPLTKEDIHELKPGQQIDVIGTKTFSHHFLQTFAPRTPGTYYYLLSYDTTGSSGRDGPQADSMLKDIARAQLRSGTVAIEVVAAE